MFQQSLPPGLFEAQKEFIKVMDSNRDFYWWANTLIKEETDELFKAHNEKEGMEQIFKELADVVYVVAGFVNVMPADPNGLISEEMGLEVQAIYMRACEAVSLVTQEYQIPLELVVAAFEVVHTSNMSKLDDDGNPIRREDGKIMKGPNYKAPDMAPIVQAWEQFVENLKKEPKDAETTE